MKNSKGILGNRLILAGIIVPVLIQLVFLFILVPAVNNADSRVSNIGIAIVCKDKQSGAEIASNLSKELPLKSETVDYLDRALDMMKAGDYSAVFYIPENFSENLLKGSNAKITYYINQAAPSMTKQVLDSAVKEISQKINENVFEEIKIKIQENMKNQLAKFNLPADAVDSMKENIGKGIDMIKANAIKGMEQQLSNLNMPEPALNKIKEGIDKGFDMIKSNSAKGIEQQLSNFNLPESAVNTINDNIGKAFDALKYEAVKSEVIKINNSDGYIQTMLPFFIFIVFFLTSVVMSTILKKAFGSFKQAYSKWTLFKYRFILNIVAALIVPIAVFTIIWSFGIPLGTSAITMWYMLSVGFLTFALFIQVLSDLLGTKGLAPAVLILFPLQMITSGLMFPEEILAVFYRWIRDFLPSSYLGSGMIKAFYGGSGIFKDINILLLMSLIFLIISIIRIALVIEKSEGTTEKSLGGI